MEFLPTRARILAAIQTAALAVLWLFKTPFRWWRSYPRSDRLTFFVAIFTALLALETGLQVWAFIQSERAFVFQWTSAVIPSPLIPGKQIVISVHAENSGHLAAFVNESNVTEMFLKEPLPKEPKYAAESPNDLSGPIPPGITFSGTIPLQTATGVPLAPDQESVNAINNGATRLYVYGWIKYTDALSLFGPKITGFCGVYVPTKPVDDAFDNCRRLNYVYAR